MSSHDLFRRIRRTLLAMAFAVVAAPGAAQNGPYAAVTLELTPQDSACASVDPESVVVYTEGGSPRAVEWTVQSKSSTQAWVMEYASDKPGASAPGFGSSYTIPCGTTASVTSNDATSTGTWVYRVKVYDCVSGQPAGEPVCTVDPQVVIEEPPGGEPPRRER